MATRGNDPYVYNMRYPKTGLCVILNNENYGSTPRYTDRSGSSSDAIQLTSVFEALGFTVIRYDNKTNVDVYKILQKLASEDGFTSYACFVCVLLSHFTEDDELIGINGAGIKLSFLIDLFKGGNCETLKGKPKVFLMEGLRGSDVDHGVEQSDADAEHPSARHLIPWEADILLGFSTCPGYVSWRRSKAQGSYYIQALCGVIAEHKHDWTLLQMLSRVSAIIAHEFESKHREAEFDKCKQQPVIVSQLTKELYFM